MPDEAGKEKREGEIEKQETTPSEAGTASSEDVKAQYEALVKEHEALKVEQEKAQKELLSPDYLEHRAKKLRGEPEPQKPVEEEAFKLPISEDAFEAMSAKEQAEFTLAVAREEAKDRVEVARKEVAGQLQQREQTRYDREIAAFRAAHPDFDQIQPVLYGISVQNPQLGIQQVYDKAKAYLKTQGVQEATNIVKNAPKVRGGEAPTTASPEREKNEREKIIDRLTNDPKYESLRKRALDIEE